MHECDYSMFGGSGGPPPENFEKRLTLKPDIVRLWGSPRVGGGVGGGGAGIRFSHQICTDLKNGPDELQKA